MSLTRAVPAPSLSAPRHVQVHVNKVLLNITKSMKYPDSCTFTFAGYHNPMAQHLYKCTVCNQTVCLVCSYKCHKTTPWRHSVEHTHELVYMGRVEGYCGCHKVRRRTASWPCDCTLCVGPAAADM